jgi:four helix bundle protein
MRDHTKLKAFELADRLALEVYRATRRFPKEELFGLTSQLRRASVSVPCNIVEGCARNSEADYAHFLNLAFASAHEAQYQISLSSRLGYLCEADHQLLRDLAEQTSKVLGGLMRAFARPRGVENRPRAASPSGSP